MGEVGVHLQHQAGAGLERPVESGDVGGPEAFLARPPQNLDLLVPGGEPPAISPVPSGELSSTISTRLEAGILARIASTIASIFGASS